jgi:hypothetical protein
MTAKARGDVRISQVSLMMVEGVIVVLLILNGWFVRDLANKVETSYKATITNTANIDSHEKRIDKLELQSKRGN